jgi:hypothetical protein
MTDETLSTELSYATVVQNLADNPTPVTTWDVPEGTAIRLAQGHPAILDVDAAGGGNLSRATSLGLAYREPNDQLDAWTVISDFSIAPFNTLSLKAQQSGENAQRRRVRFAPERVPEGRLTLEDADELALVVNGPDQIDAASLFFNYPMQVMNR